MDVAFKATFVGRAKADKGGWRMDTPGIGFDLFEKADDQLDADLVLRRPLLRLDSTDWCWQRRFGITDSGLIGLFPAVAKPETKYAFSKAADHVTSYDPRLARKHTSSLENAMFMA